MPTEQGPTVVASAPSERAQSDDAPLLHLQRNNRVVTTTLTAPPLLLPLLPPPPPPPLVSFSVNVSGSGWMVELMGLLFVFFKPFVSVPVLWIFL